MPFPLASLPGTSLSSQQQELGQTSPQEAEPTSSFLSKGILQGDVLAALLPCAWAEGEQDPLGSAEPQAHTLPGALSPAGCAGRAWQELLCLTALATSVHHCTRVTAGAGAGSGVSRVTRVQRVPRTTRVPRAAATAAAQSTPHGHGSVHGDLCAHT